VDKPPKPVDPSFQAMAEVLSLGMSYQLAASPDGTGRRFLYVSESCLALNGVTSRAVMADSRVFYDLVVPEHQAVTAEATTQAILARQPLMVEYAIRKPDGETGWRRATSAPRPELTEDGWSIWDGLQVDITEHKLAELELEAQRQRLDLAVEAAGLGLWEYDVREGRSVWSDRSKALYGLPPEAEIDFDTWFGDLVHPDDRADMAATYAAALERLDGTFSVEHRTVAPDGTVRWVLAHGRVVRDEMGPVKVLGTALDITERQAAEERRRLLVNELAHRSKNGLAMIMAIIQQSARTSETVKEYEARLVSRIGAMARSQDLVTEGVGPLTLGEIFGSALEPFDPARFQVDPALADHDVNADVALMVALLIHELGTNATKYGALSAPQGRIELSSAPARPGMVAVLWRETGGPPVTPPARTGFGARLIGAALRTYGGLARAQYLVSGLEALLEFPVQDA
jgi:PAS domain S-box-containing protein